MLPLPGYQTTIILYMEGKGNDIKGWQCFTAYTERQVSTELTSGFKAAYWLIDPGHWLKPLEGKVTEWKDPSARTDQGWKHNCTIFICLMTFDKFCTSVLHL